MTRPGPTPLPTVQLLHTLPDGCTHVDWMLAPDGETNRPLITFRLPRPLSSVSTGEEMEAVHLADHRRAYLEYEGPISGGRGEVRCIARGTYAWLDRDRDSMRLCVRWGAGAPVDCSVRLRRLEGDTWLVAGDERIRTPHSFNVGVQTDLQTEETP